MLRTVFRDILKYNEIDGNVNKEKGGETGWKLVHADVFRLPACPKVLAESVGSGMHLLGMPIVVLIFAYLGLLSPANRGALLQSMRLLFTVMGILGGFMVAHVYKVFGKGEQREATLLMAFIYLGCVRAQRDNRARAFVWRGAFYDNGHDVTPLVWFLRASRLLRNTHRLWQASRRAACSRECHPEGHPRAGSEY